MLDWLARDAFTGSVEIYTALGAAADVARVQARSAPTASGAGRTPSTGARSGWDSLTETEIKVATLVEEGMSNPEIAAKLLLVQRTVAIYV